MKRYIFEIRGNITPTIKRLEQLAKEREEQEKAEREAKYAKEREEREKKEALWKAEHPILDKYTYMSSWNYDTYSWIGEYINVHFYEWSNIESDARHFPYSIEFYRFLDSCRINLTFEQNTKFKNNSGCHITCIPGTHDLVIGKTYDELKEELQNAITLNKILSSVPEIDTEQKLLPCI